MFLKQFKGTGPGVIIFIFIVSLAVWISQFLDPKLASFQQFDDNPMPFFGLLISVTGFNPLAGVIFSYMLVLLVSGLLVSLNTSVFFIGQRTFLPAIIFVLFSGLFPVQQILNPVLPAAVFLIIALRRIIEAYKIQGVAHTFFDAGLLISIGSLFYASLIWFGVLLIIGILILRPGNFKELIISFLGLITPWFITFGVYYVTGKDINTLLSMITYNLFLKESAFVFSGLDIASVAFMVFFVFICLIYLLSVINVKKIKSRKTFNLFIWTLIIPLICYFVLKSVSIEIIWLTAIPASYIMSHYLIFAKKRFFPSLFFNLFLLLIILKQVLYVF